VLRFGVSDGDAECDDATTVTAVCAPACDDANDENCQLWTALSESAERLAQSCGSDFDDAQTAALTECNTALAEGLANGDDLTTLWPVFESCVRVAAGCAQAKAPQTQAPNNGSGVCNVTAYNSCVLAAAQDYLAGSAACFAYLPGLRSFLECVVAEGIRLNLKKLQCRLQNTCSPAQVCVQEKCVEAPTYTLAGGPNPTDAIHVDDDFVVTLNNTTIFEDLSGHDEWCGAGGRALTFGNCPAWPPITFQAKPGDVLRVMAIDYGGHQGLSGLYLHGNGAVLPVSSFVSQLGGPGTFLDVSRIVQ
jgi:hypothetical protein